MAKKQFGQNFLIDQNVIKKVLQNINWGQTNLEIGPGRMAFTSKIIDLVENLTLIEIDKTLIDDIKNKCENKIDIINEDCLKCDLNYDVIFSSLPYNISSEFILKLCTKTIYKRCYLILQKEFLERLIAKPNSKTYGALSVIAQLSAECKHLFNISKNCFSPMPKVESSFGSFIFKKSLDKNFVNFVFKCFQQRRKKMSNIIKIVDQFPLCELRPDQISPEQYEQIYGACNAPKW